MPPRGLEDLGYPAMLEARTGGYDGRGNIRVEGPRTATLSTRSPAARWSRRWSTSVTRGHGLSRCGRTRYVPGDRDHPPRGDPSGVRRASASIESRPRARPRRRARRARRDGRPRRVRHRTVRDDRRRDPLNEIAPRPHNSGHWTIEGAHLAVRTARPRGPGRPLGRRPAVPTVWTNVLGDVSERQPAELRGEDSVLGTPRAHLHWYGKREVYGLRKMGHVTLTDDDRDGLLADARDLRDGLTFECRHRLRREWDLETDHGPEPSGLWLCSPESAYGPTAVSPCGRPGGVAGLAGCLGGGSADTDSAWGCSEDVSPGTDDRRTGDTVRWLNTSRRASRSRPTRTISPTRPITSPPAASTPSRRPVTAGGTPRRDDVRGCRFDRPFGTVGESVDFDGNVTRVLMILERWCTIPRFGGERR